MRALSMLPLAGLLVAAAPARDLESGGDWGAIASADAPPSMLFLDRASIRRDGGNVEFVQLTVFRDVQPAENGYPAFDRMSQTIRADCTSLRYNVMLELTQLGRDVAPPAILMLTPGGIETAPGSIVRREIEAVCAHPISGARIASPSAHARAYFRDHPAPAPAEAAR